MGTEHIRELTLCQQAERINHILQEKTNTDS